MKRALLLLPLLSTPVELIDGEMTSWYGSRAVRGIAFLRTLRSPTNEARRR